MSPQTQISLCKQELATDTLITLALIARVNIQSLGVGIS